jgi:hypothetical protein
VDATLSIKLVSYQEAIHAAAFSPDGRLLALAGSDGRVRIYDVFGGKELVAWTGHGGEVTCVAFSPDGRTLASGSLDTSILLWDVSRLRPTPPVGKGPAKEISNLAAELESKEASKAYRAAWLLAGYRDRAVEALRARLKPVPKLDAGQIRRLITQLNDDDRKRRDEASAALEKLGPAVGPALRRALAGEQPAETRRRLRAVLRRLGGHRPGVPALAQTRALLVLELIGSPAARRRLKKLADGEPNADLTRAARAALERLRRVEKRAP